MGRKIAIVGVGAVGGYTGARWLNTIVAWRPGSPARIVATLPETLRYAAVAAVGRAIVIAGGSLENFTTTSIRGSQCWEWNLSNCKTILLSFKAAHGNSEERQLRFRMTCKPCLTSCTRRNWSIWALSQA